MMLLCLATSSLKGQLPQTLPPIPDTPTYYDYLKHYLLKYPIAGLSEEAQEGSYNAGNNVNATTIFTPLFTGGVYKSTDGGANWKSINGVNHQLLNLFTHGTVIRRIRLHPTNNKILYSSDFFNEGNLINYYFRNTGGVFEPQNVSGAFLPISTLPNNTSCQNDFALVSPPTTIKENYYSEESIRNIKDAQLSALIDGGNSTMLYNKVADAKPSTKEAVKAELVSTSPYLSEKVINKVAERGEFFTKPFQ